MSLTTNQQAWVDALRSGEFRQTSGLLTRVDEEGNESHCCLGVACVLAVRAGVPIHVENKDGTVEYGGCSAATSFLPSAVGSWLDADAGEQMTHRLAAPNDAGVPFDAIATLIEEHADFLFNRDDSFEANRRFDEALGELY